MKHYLILPQIHGRSHPDGCQHCHGRMPSRPTHSLLRRPERQRKGWSNWSPTQLRDTDILARVGGDEFGVIAPHTDPEATQQLVDRLSTALDEASVAASIGHAPYSMTAGGFAGAWTSADAAMYERKRERHKDNSH